MLKKKHSRLILPPYCDDILVLHRQSVNHIDYCSTVILHVFFRLSFQSGLDDHEDFNLPHIQSLYPAANQNSVCIAAPLLYMLQI